MKWRMGFMNGADRQIVEVELSDDVEVDFIDGALTFRDGSGLLAAICNVLSIERVGAIHFRTLSQTDLLREAFTGSADKQS